MSLLAVRLAGLLLCLFSLFAGAAPAADGSGLVAIPSLTARVTDLTGTLNSEQRQALEQQLADFQARKGAQLVVLILPTTQPETIEQFSIRIFEAWKIGRKGVDDGAMLIVAKDDRRLRIEVGYGLEGALNDAIAKRIISETITPLFKAGDFPGGISAGVLAILKIIDGEQLPEPSSAAGSGAKMNITDIPEGLLIGVLVAIVLGGTVVRHLLGNLVGSGLVGFVTGGLGWLLVGGLVGIVGGALLGIFLAVFGLDIVLSGIFSGGGRGGSGGGGFSGGGGSGGGGGASGSW
jgi:uncharacterized protein